MASSSTTFNINQHNGTRKTVQVDDFLQKTYDGYNLQVRIILGEDFAVVKLEGDVRCWYSTTLHKDDAFALLNTVSALTQQEVWNRYNFK